MWNGPAAFSVVVVLLAPVIGAQSRPVASGDQAFEVVSIKAHKPGELAARIGRYPGGRWAMVNTSTRSLILTAYPTQTHEIVGAPGWVLSERYDVDARAGRETTREQEQAMLQRLLTDRFKFAGHYETPERPIYNLVFARADRQLGPRLRRIETDCEAFQAAADAGQTAPADPPCMGGMRATGMFSTGMSMATFVGNLTNYAGRPTIDKTGLPGYYAFNLEYDRNSADGVSMFTALQEQLGLKLEPASGPVSVLVLDHIERPTEN